VEDIGKILQGLRKERGLSVRKVSEETGFSPSFLSKLENGKTSITIRNLSKLLNYYGVTLADIFSSPFKKKIIFRKEERKRLDSPEAITLELVVDEPKAGMEPIIATFQPRARYIEALQHGGEEFALVLKGEFVFELNGVPNYLREGDSVYFLGEQSHSWENLSDSVGSVIMVISPPSF
jgi:transcriptional regulator with XRE-family HTH domain